MSTPCLLSLARNLDLIHGLAMHRVFPYLAETLHGGELSFSQFNALYQLYHDGVRTISGLASATHLSHNAASRMVDGLVSAGFAERREDPGDRRQKRVELTPAGEQRLREMRDFTIKTYAELLSTVPPDVLEPLALAFTLLKPHIPTHPISTVSATSLDAEQKVPGTKTVSSNHQAVGAKK